ncbi:response regulator [Croceicoccus mobilis]|uniref:DNA-binding response regulator n=1 Tax=Croceicoccus mobilis TaxID=1703339 RepID=A0A917DYU5_9SPHN|nr:response regulator transcription factor [Croceicoccus mobilis]GGD85077.1 DNA-binding response regulator [Croceicoccus mobilis]
MTRIVLADDHGFLRKGVESVLQAGGMEVVASVGDGIAALEAVAREDPDLVILDVRMPVLGGVETLRAMRNGGDGRPVILLTAELEDKKLVEALQAKVDGIVFKEGAEARLELAIRQVLAGSRYIDIDLVDRALDYAATDAVTGPFSTLSERERKIVEAVANGSRNREVAKEIGTTEGSVKLYLHRIYWKMGVKNRTELAVMVLDMKNRSKTK